MDTHEFAESIYLNLPYEPNGQQIQLIAALSRFCSRDMPSNSVFVLNGYAGTGKTSLVGALVRSLRDVGVTVVLLAPTGRAAKVFGRFAGFPAFTIHRRIYRSPDGSMGRFNTELAENALRNAIFIVDEASMIGDEPDADAARGGLLEDLIHYVYSGDDCRMILLGDTAQLPPVGSEMSPALNPDRLRQFGLHLMRATLTEVVRQGQQSGILYNATWLRRAMRQNPLPAPEIRVRGFNDVEVVEGFDLEDSLSASYSDYGVGETLVVTRSNRRAVAFNLAIRSKILYREEELCVGERLMIAKNNYLWSARVKGLDFVANGETAIVDHIYGTESRYGFRFADVNLRLSDRDDISFDCKILLDTLISEAPSLERDRFNALHLALLNDTDLFAPATSMNSRLRMLRSNPYLNALQVKYAYCVTCHKAQGGQWESVYVDMGFMPADSSDMDFLRWTYTAVTRATRKLFLINASDTIIS